MCGCVLCALGEDAPIVVAYCRTGQDLTILAFVSGTAILMLRREGVSWENTDSNSKKEFVFSGHVTGRGWNFRWPNHVTFARHISYTFIFSPRSPPSSSEAAPTVLHLTPSSCAPSPPFLFIALNVAAVPAKAPLRPACFPLRRPTHLLLPSRSWTLIRQIRWATAQTHVPSSRSPTTTSLFTSALSSSFSPSPRLVRLSLS